MSIVTISRGSHSGAKAIAEGVAERLSVPCVSREIIVEAAEAAGISVGAMADTLDKPPSFFERLSKDRDTYLVFVRAALHRNAAAGSFVYHGHDGHLLLDLPNVLRVRVVAPLAYRVAAVRDALGLDEREAQRHIAKIDRHRAKWTRFLYGVDWNDPLHYDLILNLEKVDVGSAVDLVADLARSERFAWTGPLRREAANQALVNDVRAALVKVPETRNAELEIAADDGVVLLRGSTRDDELRRLIVAAAGEASAAKEVRCEISIPADLLRG
jgi:cytidylate kinase